MYDLSEYLLENNLLHCTGLSSDYIFLAINVINDYSEDTLSQNAMGNDVASAFMRLDDDLKRNINSAFVTALSSGKYETIENIKKASRIILLNRLGSEVKQINTLISLFAAHRQLFVTFCEKLGIDYYQQMAHILRDMDMDLSVDELTVNANFLNNFLYHEMSALKRKMRNVDCDDKDGLRVVDDEAKTTMNTWLASGNHR